MEEGLGARALLAVSLLQGGKPQLRDQPERLRGKSHVDTLYMEEPIEYRWKTRRYPGKPVHCESTGDEPVKMNTGGTSREKYLGNP